MDIHAAKDAGEAGHWAQIDFQVPEAGTYEVLFSGNSLARLKPPRSLSPFVWSIDGGKEHAADNALPVRRGVRGAPEGLSTLGTLDLDAGKHTFRLKLTGRRDRPDTRYALWFDAIALRKKAQTR
jgi:hypothetical protein